MFAVAVFESFVFLIANGALDWGPVKRLATVATIASTASRTADDARSGGSASKGRGEPPNDGARQPDGRST